MLNLLMLFGSILAAAWSYKVKPGQYTALSSTIRASRSPGRRLVLFTPGPWTGVREPVELRTKTDVHGDSVHALAMAAGALLSNLGVSSGLYRRVEAGNSPPFDLVLRKAQAENSQGRRSRRPPRPRSQAVSTDPQCRRPPRRPRRGARRTGPSTRRHHRGGRPGDGQLSDGRR